VGRGPRPALLAVDRSAGVGPAAPSLRDVARGARAGPAGAFARRARGALAHLLVPAPGDRGARAGRAAEARRPVGVVPAFDHAAHPLVASRAAPPDGCPPAQLAR